MLDPPQWRPREAAHHRRVDPWLQPRLARRRQGLRHPVDDFLFEYYRLRPQQLRDWHPGWRLPVRGCDRLAAHRDYRSVAPGVTGVDPAAVRNREPRIRRGLAILRATADRPAAFGCFGLHEWAMVHGSAPELVRHSAVGLRVDQEVVAATVAEVGLRCTHFDAYRFFTPAATQRQRPLSRDRQQADEQPGCIHAGMDLYRYAYEALPAVSSELVADCLEFARAAREVDMRASPYDLAALGLTAIEVETPAGRREYAARQRELAQRAAPLRDRLVAELAAVLRWAGTA